MSPRPSRSPGNEAVPPTRKWKIRNYRYTKLKNSDLIKEGAETLNDLKTLLSMRDVESEIDIEQKISLI